MSLPDFLGRGLCYLVTMWSLSHRSAKDNYRMTTQFEFGEDEPILTNIFEMG